MKGLAQFIGVCLLALVAVGCIDNSATPEKTAERFVSGMFAYGGPTVYNLLYIENNGTIVNEDMLKGKVRNLVIERSKIAHERGGIKEAKYSPTKYTNSTKTEAYIDIDLIFKDGSFQNIPLELIQVDDKWLIKLHF